MKALFRTFVIIVFGLLAQYGVSAQSPRTESAKPQPQIDSKARFRSLDGTTPISLADYQGKVVVLTLWASWCAPCLQAMYGLTDLNKEFAGRGVQVIALSTEDPQEADADVRRCVAGFHPDYRVGWISTISAGKLMAGEDVLPQTFVIRDGVILKSFVGWHPTQTMIELRTVLKKQTD